MTMEMSNREITHLKQNRGDNRNDQNDHMTKVEKQKIRNEMRCSRYKTFIN